MKIETTPLLLLVLLLTSCRGELSTPLAFQAVGETGSVYQSNSYGTLGTTGKAAYRFRVSGDPGKARATLRVTSQTGAITLKAWPETWKGAFAATGCKPIHSEPVPTCELILAPLETDKYALELTGESTGRDYYMFVSIQGAVPEDWSVP